MADSRRDLGRVSGLGGWAWGGKRSGGLGFAVFGCRCGCAGEVKEGFAPASASASAAQHSDSIQPLSF
mgnify:CR=1 FL=1